MKAARRFFAAAGDLLALAGFFVFFFVAPFMAESANMLRLKWSACCNVFADRFPNDLR